MFSFYISTGWKSCSFLFFLLLSKSDFVLISTTQSFWGKKMLKIKITLTTTAINSFLPEMNTHNFGVPIHPFKFQSWQLNRLMLNRLQLNTLIQCTSWLILNKYILSTYSVGYKDLFIRSGICMLSTVKHKECTNLYIQINIFHQFLLYVGSV